MANAKRFAAGVVTAAMLAYTALPAYAMTVDFSQVTAAESSGTEQSGEDGYASITPPGEANGPSLIQQNDDGYNSITIYDGVHEVENPQYTGNAQGSVLSAVSSLKYYPFEITNVKEEDIMLVVKSFEVPAGTNPQELVEPGIIRKNKQYIARDILEKKLQGSNDEKEASTDVTVSVDSKDKDKAIAAIKAQMGETKAYDSGGYSGTLHLDPDSITFEQSGTTSYSYQVTDTREYTGLERNDPSLISKTITKNGVTLNMQDVEWVSMGSTVSGDSIVQTYKAVVSYSGTANGTKASGYTAKAIYRGMVSKETHGGYIYSIIYAPYDTTTFAIDTPDNALTDADVAASKSGQSNPLSFPAIPSWLIYSVLGVLATILLLISGACGLKALKKRKIQSRSNTDKSLPVFLANESPKSPDEDVRIFEEDGDTEEYKANIGDAFEFANDKAYSGFGFCVSSEPESMVPYSYTGESEDAPYPDPLYEVREPSDDIAPADGIEDDVEIVGIESSQSSSNENSVQLAKGGMKVYAPSGGNTPVINLGDNISFEEMFEKEDHSNE